MLFQVISEGNIQRGEGFEVVTIARDETAVTIFNVCEASEAIVLDFKKPIGMVEGLRSPRDRQGLVVRWHSFILAQHMSRERAVLQSR